MRSLLAPLLFGLIGAAILVSLGVWQLQRLEWKRGILDAIEARIDAAPGPLPTHPDPDLDRYTPVALEGAIAEGEVHVLVSVKRKGPGYRVIAPFVTEDGRRLLLDRGFVPSAEKDAPRPIGAAHIVGNLHWPDDRASSTPENDEAANIWFARDIPQMASALDAEPVMVIARTSAPAAPGLTPIPVDTGGIPNDHLQYAITWFSLAAVWLLMSAVYIWRSRKT